MHFSLSLFPFLEHAQRLHLRALPYNHKHEQVQREHHLPPGDFPDVARFRDILSAFDFSHFPKLSKSMVKQVRVVVLCRLSCLCAGGVESWYCSVLTPCLYAHDMFVAVAPCQIAAVTKHTHVVDIHISVKTFRILCVFHLQVDDVLSVDIPNLVRAFDNPYS